MKEIGNFSDCGRKFVSIVQEVIFPNELQY